MRLLLFLLLALAVPQTEIPESRKATPAEAPVVGFMSGERLEGLCDVPDDDATGALETCLSYIAGATDLLLAVDALDGRRSLCPTTDVIVGSIREDFLEFIRENPEHRSMPASLTIAMVVSQVFRCRAFAEFPKVKGKGPKD
jgi:hypothetical protein